jgi:methionyl-tRNA synthetase
MRAEQEGTTPKAIADKYHAQFLDCWQKLGISFDLFTATGTPNHAEVTHDIFLTLLNKGYVYKDTALQAYCPRCRRFLPDRYVEGVCPYCAYPKARGDQCDECGKPLNPSDLSDVRCRICGGKAGFEMSEHFFLRLSAFQEELRSWTTRQDHWRENVLATTRKFLNEGLRDRAITRDIEWGVTVPQPGFERKRVYVWFEAVIGYLSASKEWAKSQGDGLGWRPFWEGDCKSYYFVGKDNIFFHTIIWPAMLMGYGGLNLPYDVPANEFLIIEGARLSTSRNWAVWLPDYLERYDPDALRYVLSVNMPETKDSEFSWDRFVDRNNNELVATYGNLAHRVLTFTQRNFGGVVPSPGDLDEGSRSLLQRAEDTLSEADRSLCGCSFRQGIRSAMYLAQQANRYLDEQAPWKAIKGDRNAAARSAYTILAVLSVLRTVLYPFLPFSSERLHRFLGFSGSVRDFGWSITFPVPGTPLGKPEPLFSKIEETVATDEMKRLGHPSGEHS